MIDAVREHELTAFTGGDADAFEALFTSDCQILPPGEPAVVGRDKGREWLEDMSNQFTISGEYTGSDIDVSEGLVIVRYTAVLGLTPKADGNKIEAAVKGIHIYRQQDDGSWQIAYDIWNFDSAPTPSE